MAPLLHAPRRGLSDHEGGDFESPPHRLRIEGGERAGGPGAGIVDHHVGLTDPGIGLGEQPLDRPGIGGIGREGPGPGLGGEVGELVGVAGGEADPQPLGGEMPGERGADDEGGAAGQAQGRSSRGVGRSKTRQVVLAVAQSRPASSARLASATAWRRPAWTTRPVAVTQPETSVTARR